MVFLEKKRRWPRRGADAAPARPASEGEAVGSLGPPSRCERVPGRGAAMDPGWGFMCVCLVFFTDGMLVVDRFWLESFGWRVGKAAVRPPRL
ncbi:MAG: hypothetical protein DRH24_12025 [Deltaproteobacteria bacterium]|nr:MAG: hypothetical protein DRH24_12025 [Deltaproteobacteria bacterium]